MDSVVSCVAVMVFVDRILYMRVGQQFRERSKYPPLKRVGPALRQGTDVCSHQRIVGPVAGGVKRAFDFGRRMCEKARSLFEIFYFIFCEAAGQEGVCLQYQSRQEHGIFRRVYLTFLGFQLGLASPISTIKRTLFELGSNPLHELGLVLLVPLLGSNIIRVHTYICNLGLHLIHARIEGKFNEI